MKNTLLTPEDRASIIDDMQRGIAALKAFSTIIDAVLVHDGGCLQSSDSGLAALIDRHIDALAEGLDSLHAYERAAIQQRAL